MELMIVFLLKIAVVIGIYALAQQELFSLYYPHIIA